MTHLYFSLTLKREIIDLVRRRNAAGLVCEIGICAGQARKGMRCTFVVPQDLSAELDPELMTAASLGAGVEKTTLQEEERKLACHSSSMLHRFAPKKADEFIGFWFSRLEHHVCAWDVKRTPVVFLICGPAGVGKTCAAEVVLPLKLGKRYCKVYTVAPEELDDERQINDLKIAAGQTTDAYDTALEHCRRVKTGQLPKDAMFIAFYDDIDMITSSSDATRVKNDFAKIGKLTKQFPTNVSLVAACTNWYSRSTLVRSLRTDKATGFVVDVCNVAPLSVDSIMRRLKQCFADMPLDKISEIAHAAGGNMWAALHTADFQRLQVPLKQRERTAISVMDRENNQAACAQIVDLVRIKRTKRSMFSTIDLRADIDYATDAIFANYSALVPTSNRQRTSDHDILRAMETIADVVDMLGVGDLYNSHQRDGNFAGHDGVDTDKQISTALSVTVPCVRLSLATAAASRPASGRMIYVDEKAKMYRETSARTSDLLAVVVPQLLFMEWRPHNIALVLENWRLQAACRDLTSCSIDWITQLFYMGKRGMEFLYNLGFSKDDVIRIVWFARSLKTPTLTIASLTTEYEEIEKRKGSKFVPRLPVAGVDGAPKQEKKRKKDAAPATKENAKKPKQLKQTKIKFGQLVI